MGTSEKLIKIVIGYFIVAVINGSLSLVYPFNVVGMTYILAIAYLSPPLISIYLVLFRDIALRKLFYVMVIVVLFTFLFDQLLRSGFVFPASGLLEMYLFRTSYNLFALFAAYTIVFNRSLPGELFKRVRQYF